MRMAVRCWGHDHSAEGVCLLDFGFFAIVGVDSVPCVEESDLTGCPPEVRSSGLTCGHEGKNPNPHMRRLSYPLIPAYVIAPDKEVR